MSRRFTLGVTAALILAAACGGSDNGPTDPGTITPPNGTMSARIDGAAWAATAIAVTAQNGHLIVSGGSSNGQGVAIGASTVPGPGTQTIGGNTNAAAQGVITVGTQSWSANAIQGSGTVTITTLTANRAAGTFSFTAPALSAGATPATRVVTAGQFDVRF